MPQASFCGCSTGWRLHAPELPDSQTGRVVIETDLRHVGSTVEVGARRGVLLCSDMRSLWRYGAAILGCRPHEAFQSRAR
jgi:hypothetical protein